MPTSLRIMVRNILAAAICTLPLSFFTACGGATARIKEAINEQWPPVSTLDRRAQALAASDYALQSLRPVAYLALDRDALDRIPAVVSSQLALAQTKNPQQPLPKLSNLRVRAEQEGISVVSDFVLEVANPPVIVSGKFDGSMTVAPHGDLLQPALAFNKVEVRELTWTKGPVSGNLAVPAINSVLRSTIENVNGAINLQPIPLAFAPIAAFDPATIKAQGLTVRGDKVDMPVPSVGGLTLLATDDTLQIIADLRLPGEADSTVPGPAISPAQTEAAFNAEFEQFRSHFEAIRDEAFGSQVGGTKAAVTRPFIAALLNTTIHNKALHLDYAFPEQSQQFNQDIRPYTSPQINCDSQEDTRDCRPANNCQHPHDERNCKTTINVGGWNIIKQEINDPGCELAKATQNQIYDRNFDACNAAYAASIPVCETAKASQNTIYAAKKAACEVDKARLQEIEKLAHVGHISGDFDASGAAVADVHNFGVGTSLETIAMDTVIAGNANVVAHVKFDPDTAGRLACTFGWDKDLKTNVSLQQQALPIRGTISGGEDGTLVIALKGSSVSIQLDPPPVQAVFVAHPELVVECAPLVSSALVPGLTYRALQQHDIPSEISGHYEISIPDSEIKVPLQTFSLKVGAENINLQPKLSSKAAWFTTR